MSDARENGNMTMRIISFISSDINNRVACTRAHILSHLYLWKLYFSPLITVSIPCDLSVLRKIYFMEIQEIQINHYREEIMKIDTRAKRGIDIKVPASN